MNTLKCGLCAFYDPILARNEKETKRGWCVKRSVYPAQPGPGQVFPPDAVRQDDPKALGEPYIVRKSEVVLTCAYAKAGRGDAAKKKKAAQEALTLTPSGKRILQ